MINRLTFRAMGTDVELLLDAPPSAESALALAMGEVEFRRLEARLSRFRLDSELSALNRLGRLEASSDLVRVIEVALEARCRTSGRFDPTVHDALVGIGYDRSFEEVAGRVAIAAPPARCGGWVRIDTATGLIELEPGVRLDLGGIAKGYAVDRVSDLLEKAGPCLVNAGGDLATRRHAWPVGVETPDGMLTLELGDGALATSGIDRRRWQTADGEAHHLIDPARGRPAETDLLRVTVVASNAVEADVLAKALFLAGAERAEAEANELATPTVLVTKAGRTVLAGGLQ